MSQLDDYLEKQGALVEQLAQAAEMIPAGKEGWTPHEGALMWLRLVDHMAISRRHLILKSLKGEELDFPGAQFDPANQSKTGAESARAHRESWEEVKSYLSSRGEGFLREEVAFTRGRRWPVYKVLWYGYEENLHHRGQLWIYSRLNGLVPPKVWGTEGMLK